MLDGNAYEAVKLEATSGLELIGGERLEAVVTALTVVAGMMATC
jgi:hypothetical protein